MVYWHPCWLHSPMYIFPRQVLHDRCNECMTRMHACCCSPGKQLEVSGVICKWLHAWDR